MVREESPPLTRRRRSRARREPLTSREKKFLESCDDEMLDMIVRIPSFREMLEDLMRTKSRKRRYAGSQKATRKEGRAKR